METQGTRQTWSGNKLYRTLRLLAYLIISIFPISLRATTLNLYCRRLSAYVDTPIAESLKSQLTSHKNDLYYPKSVARFYQQNGYRLLWLAPGSIRTPATEAMLMLDCVFPFGLAYEDYHPDELLADKLYYFSTHFDQTGNDRKSSFDILLTDALLYMINNLHYGKLNPDFPASYLDTASANEFIASQLLRSAIQGKGFKEILETAQPVSGAYQDLKHQLELLSGAMFNP